MPCEEGTIQRPEKGLPELEDHCVKVLPIDDEQKDDDPFADVLKNRNDRNTPMGAH